MQMKTLVGVLTVSAVTSFYALTAQAENACEITIDSDDTVEFDRSEIRVPPGCEQLRLTLTHSGDRETEDMGHNWVLAKSDDWQALAEDAMHAGPENDYLPPGDPRILAYTDLIGGGESTTTTIDLAHLEPETSYTYFCSFADHAQPMNGSFIIEEP